MSNVSNVTPTENRIYVKPDDGEKVSRGGIIIPENAVKKTGTGVVRAMGPGMLRKNGSRWPMPDGLKVGDRVVFDKDHPFPRINLDGEELLILRDDTVLAIVEQ
jgi:chaperonin GroES